MRFLGSFHDTACPSGNNVIECVSETIVFLYRKRTALPAPSCYEVLAAEVLGGQCTLQAHFRCTPPVSGSIPARRNPLSGIIFPRRKHPCSEKSPVRDYFPETKASLLREISRQGLFSRGGCIPARGNLPSGIIFPRLTLCPQSYTDLSRIRRTQANVYQSYLISWRTASFASSAAPEAGAVIPSCAPHYGHNFPVFFPERG